MTCPNVPAFLPKLSPCSLFTPPTSLHAISSIFVFTAVGTARDLRAWKAALRLRQQDRVGPSGGAGRRGPGSANVFAQLQNSSTASAPDGSSPGAMSWPGHFLSGGLVLIKPGGTPPTPLPPPPPPLLFTASPLKLSHPAERLRNTHFSHFPPPNFPLKFFCLPFHLLRTCPTPPLASLAGCKSGPS